MNEIVTRFETCPICGGKEPYPADQSTIDNGQESVCQKCWHELNLYVYTLTERIDGAALLVHLCDEKNPHAIALVKSLLYPNGTSVQPSTSAVVL